MNQRQTAVSLRLSDAGLRFIADREAESGPVLHAYSDLDPWAKPIPVGELTRGVITIGYGHTRTARAGMRITEAEAIALLRSDVREAEMLVHQHVKVPLWQHEFDAMVSIVFNVKYGRPRNGDDPGEDGIIVLKSGQPSSLLKALNAGDYKEAAGWFTAWFKTKGAELGLYRRRIAEKLMFEGLPWLRAFQACRSLAYTEAMAYNDAMDEATDVAALARTQTQSDEWSLAWGTTPAAAIPATIEVEPKPTAPRTPAAAPAAVTDPASAPIVKPAPPPAPPAAPAAVVVDALPQPSPPPPPTAAPKAEILPPVPAKNPLNSWAVWGGCLLYFLPELAPLAEKVLSTEIAGPIGQLLRGLAFLILIFGRMAAVAPLSIKAPVRVPNLTGAAP